MAAKNAAGVELVPGWHPLVTIHVVGAVGALGLGLLALRWAGRSTWDRHRLAGKGYVLCVLVSAVSSLPLILSVTGGLPALLGFALLYALWALTIGLGLAAIRRKDLANHRRWMIRSYAVTLANLTLHLLWPLLRTLTGEDVHSYAAAVLLCGPINLAIAERWLRRR